MCQLGIAKVVVRTEKRNSIDIGQMVQHGQEIEGFRVPFSVIVGTDLVAFEKLGDEGEIAHVFERVAGAASELLEGGTDGFLCKNDCTSSKNIFCMSSFK